MVRLEDLKPGTRLRGLHPAGIAAVKSVTWYGDHGLEVVFEANGALSQRLVFRDDEPSFELVAGGRPWSFDGDGALLRLVSEAWRIRLAWLFDPYLAITTSTIDPLPHQISAVYESMLPRQPMRFLLADDPGAGKTIMAGLLVKELLVRGELERCLIVAPGSLTEQWQDELSEKFGLDFEILTSEMIRSARTGNPFEDKRLLIARLDQLSRNEDLQDVFKAAPEWDLVICDEAHRMSGHYMGGEVKLTKRYKLGMVLGEHCRNLLLMTATPHNGHEEDFQLFLALLDGDRFEGRARDGVHSSDPSDLMRRMVKEDLYKFDGCPLFPERRSYTASYPLSDGEARLYADVTDYVREEMDRVERFDPDEGQRKVNVGFALMTLQRRLASSPEAIFRSIERRRERLEKRMREALLLLRGGSAQPLRAGADEPTLSDDDLDDLYDEAPQEERERVEEALIDNATAARTVAELQTEIERLKVLEGRAKTVRLAGTDAKWQELKTILNHPLMVDEGGNRRKLVIFTEFRDTLAYLATRIRDHIGRAEAVVEIHGGVTRDDRRRVVHAFMNDPTVLVLLANDAAGEGVNLQRAHLMVNYDLPWNPNRLEQRFGRIHRIGQDEVCHLWNLIAENTREGEVYIRLLKKLEAERESLGGKVYDVLGQLFEQRALRDLLMEAIRYGSDPAVKRQLQVAVDNAVNRERLAELLEQRQLVHNHMDTTRIQHIREDMERAHARRLQPHYVESFFREAFVLLGGQMHRREPGRFEVNHVPVAIRERDRQLGAGAPVLKRYERICFNKDLVAVQPRAQLLTPGSPLLDATIDLVLERYREVLKQGAVLIDENDDGDKPRLLFYLEHSVLDGRQTARRTAQVISTRMQFVEARQDGGYANAGVAPYLDYRPATEPERATLQPELDAHWMRRDWEHEVLGYAIRELVPAHVEECKRTRLPLIDKVEREVRSRLGREINYWDHRAEDLRAQERAGKQTRLPAQAARDRADRLSDRLQRRVADLARERAITAQAPEVRGGALVVPRGLLSRLAGAATPATLVDAAARAQVEMAAMAAVMAFEIRAGRTPSDRSAERGIGYDIESRDPLTGELLFIEVKGRAGSDDHVTLSRTEVLCALNEPEKFRLAVVLVEGDTAREPVYVRGFDFGQPGFAQTGSTYSLGSLLAVAAAP